MGKNTGKEHSHGLVMASMKENGRMGNFTGKEHLPFLMGIKGLVSSEIINLGTSPHMTKTETTNGNM